MRAGGSARSKTLFECAGCGHQEPRWLGRCPSCGKWNSFAEVAAAAPVHGVAERADGPGLVIPLSAIETREGMRLDTGIAEMNRVLGGGLMRGSSVLMGGEPGIGKSTLMLQLAARLRGRGRSLYVSGEESPGQLRLRADRIGVSSERIEVVAETELTAIMQVLEQVKPVLIIADSLQTLYTREVNALPGTINQIKACTQELVDWARSRDAALVLVAHVTKEGAIAGPKLVEHLVDTVVSFEQASAEIRTLQAVKNRFGSVDEIGFFRMTDRGLVEVDDANSLFLTSRKEGNPPGVAVAPVFEGSRVLLVEIQSLSVPAKSGISRIYSDRIDAGRVARVAAVLEKHLGLHLAEHDIYVNVAGGIRIGEVGVELPLALALYSARTGLTLPAGTAVTGEVSLTGEVRPVPGIEKRARACLEMGFTSLIGPAGDAPAAVGFSAVEVVAEAVRIAFAHAPAD
ncbi:MAG TPA: DNA repair protein RadA [Spirochaetia bacterium]|nr:DNA repair protein RadA [Spirochaetia bacterium]